MEKNEVKLKDDEMRNLLLQTMVEKLEGIELFLKVFDTGKEEFQKFRMEMDFIRKEIKNLPANINLDTGKLKELRLSIEKLLEQLQTPVKNQTYHHHHLHKGVWIIIGLFVICFLISWGWLNCSREKEVFAADAIKYRFLKVSNHAGIVKYCDQTDSLYQHDPDGFVRKVEDEELWLVEQAQKLRLAGEKEKEARTLKEQAGRPFRKP